MRNLYSTALLTIGLLVTGCNSNPFYVEITDCPAVAFVKEANTVTRFTPNGNGRIEDVAYTATLTNLAVDCQDKGEGVRTTISFDILAKAGFAGTGSYVDIPYFVAVARGGNEMVSKEVFMARVNMAPSLGRGGSRERFTQIIPTDGLAKEHLYEVLIGFQLSEDEAAYNIRN